MHTNPSLLTRVSACLKTVGSIGVALGLVFGVSACSSDEEPDICSLSSELANADGSSKNVVADSRKIATKVNAVEAPAEIKDEWAVVVDYHSTLADKLDGAADDDQDAYTNAVIELGDTLDADEMNQASKKVTEYVDNNCGG